MDLYKRIVIFLLMYTVSLYLLFIASQHAPYLLPVIWFAALILLVCGVCYIFHHYVFRSRKKRSR